MLQIEIPGREQPLRLDVLVLDYNGTIACDGQLIDGIGGIREALSALREMAGIEPPKRNCSPRPDGAANADGEAPDPASSENR